MSTAPVTLWSRRIYGRTTILALIFAPTAAALGADKAEVSVEKVEYKGWKNNLRLSNGEAELIVTLDVGPRVISYRRADGKNVFKEYAEMLGKSGEPEWQIRGGHRLWAAPEDPQRTYALDNGPIASQTLAPGSIRVKPAREAAYGLQKEMDITLAPSGTNVTVVHRIRNIGARPTDLAAWALSVMAPGGVEIIPLPPHRPHPGAAKNAKSPTDFLASYSISVWPFTDFTDPRWHFGSQFITLRQDAQRGATKLGVSHRTGWVGYLNGGTLFVKRFLYIDGYHYPDNGCSFETFTNEDMLEVESLGPLVRLNPGQDVEHVEKWELIADFGEVKTEEDIAKVIVPKVTHAGK